MRCRERKRASNNRLRGRSEAALKEAVRGYVYEVETGRLREVT
jgi:hypothetical protein